ncbi:MAG TPA: hypothetical protein PK239_11845 [Chitinophagales bacterium]|nr:hypothetical protein [Chitinophagales bacterium]HRK27963.1 hypothetical protein [Chitinophagales bacterium]
MNKNLWRSNFFKLPQHKQFNYIPRYYDPEKDKLNPDSEENELKLERGAFFKQKNRSRLVGAFTGNKEVQTFERYRYNQNNQLLRILMLVGLLSISTLVFFDKISLTVAVPFLFLFVVVFIAKARAM